MNNRIDNIREELGNVVEPLYKKRTHFTYTTPEENDIIGYIETEFSCLSHIDDKDYFKKWNLLNIHRKIPFFKKYPKDISDLYRDQSIHNISYGERHIMSAYLEYGLKSMDSFFSNEIRLGKESKYTKDELKRMIRRNPHLHNLIKENLLDNLKRYE
ncbi:hypothetical protein M0Q50_09995 [bacterium]|jgi:hypothetical protein|nr:hypothetical protein [bacterium]